MLARNIPFVSQHKFADCRHIQPLPWDAFFLDECVADLDGRQHFEVSFFGNEPTDLDLQRKKDGIKNDWARKTNKHLLRVSYSEIARMDEHFDHFHDAIKAAGKGPSRPRVEMFFGQEYGTDNYLTSIRTPSSH